MDETRFPHSDFIRAACAPRGGDGHASGTLADADTILAAHPDVADQSVYAAAILGDAAGVRRFLARNPSLATEKGGPHEWDALTYLCFSRYLRLDRTRADAFVAAAAELLDAGADANTGWFETNHLPRPEWESVLYGAAGVAHHPALTRLLLARGANPNDDETPYHVSEGYDNAAMQIIVESGKLTAESLTTLLLRKCDWHDRDGIRWLLAHGADPNRISCWDRSALIHAVQRDNDLSIIEVMLEHGGDADAPSPPSRHALVNPTAPSAAALAARRGRGDILKLLEQRGVPARLEGSDRLFAACACDDVAAVHLIAARDPGSVANLVADGGRALAEFAGVGNTSGVGHLLDLGVDITARYSEGDGYFDIAPNSLAIHVAAWRGRHSTVALLVSRGSPIDVADGEGRTPLALAVRACVDSYWTDLRSADSVRVLLDNGAAARHSAVIFPSGYAEVDELLSMRRSSGEDQNHFGN